jgi:Zn-dependent alcohol dehydrogenase
MVINTFKNLIQPEKINVLLIGFGGVGSAAALALTKFEFCTVYLLESSPQKREVAEKFKFKKIFETIQDIDSFFETCDFKFDYCFETAGHVETIEFGFRSISNKGKLIFASHPVSGELLKLDPFEFIKGKQIAGTWGGNEDPAEIIIEISNILSRNLHLVDLFIGEIYTLEEINLAIESLSLGVNMKPILSLRSE